MTGLYLIAVIILIIVSCLLIVTMMGMIGVIICIPNTKKFFENVYIEAEDNEGILDKSIEAILSERRYRCSFIYRFVKRTFDILISLIGIIIFSPFMLITAIILRMENKGKGVFRKRKIVGYKGKELYVYSFQYSKEGKSALLYSILYKTGLNNLPMYFSVLRGNLCLVGLSRMDNFDDKNRIKIYNYEKPGMVCLANLYDAYEYMDTSRWDFLYLKRRNIRMDVRIILGCVMMPVGGFSRKKKISGNENTSDIKYENVGIEANADSLEKSENEENVVLICPNCLQELPNELSKGLVFCPYCGNKVENIKSDSK